MYIDVYKFLIRILQSEEKPRCFASILMRSYLKEKACCVGKKVSIYIKETGVSAHAAGKGFPILHTFPPAFAEYSLWVGDFPSASVGLSPVERRMQSLPLAAVALAVGARGTVCPP